MIMRQFIAALLLLLPSAAGAQNTAPADTTNYPKDYFRNPLDIPIFLAGNFGECRPGHFHSGVDIKTLGKENQPVHAAADGYISRIKMEKGGFGHGLYITHPNGYTTLYAHLNDFTPALQAYLKKEQYAKKHWDVDIQLTPDQFPVKKGDQIAWSGNTGASTAPHLHFEIRNTKTEHPLNPELFGLPIVDDLPPVPTELVIYHGQSFYEMTRGKFSLEKKGDKFTLGEMYRKSNPDYRANGDTIIISGTGAYGIGLNVDDHINGSENTLAFYTVELYLDDTLQTKIKLDNIGYEETRYINAYADYKIKDEDDEWIQCLFKLAGNHLESIYSYLNKMDGRLTLTDTKTHLLSIIISDDKHNKSKVLAYIRSEGGNCHYCGLPTGNMGRLTFYPNRLNGYSGKDYRFALEFPALYDIVTFVPRTINFDSGYSDKHEVLQPYVPVHTSFALDIKPTKQIDKAVSGKIVMMYNDGKGIDGRSAAITDSGWYRARVRNFGTYWLDVDTTAPAIKSMQTNDANLSKSKQITFEVKDNKTSVRKFSGTLDGKWICFEQHSNLFFYKFDEHCAKGKHHLVFTAEDENGNSANYHLNFTR